MARPSQKKVVASSKTPRPVRRQKTRDEDAQHAAAENDPNTPIELFFGLVGPTGVDLTHVCQSLDSRLKAVGYETRTVRLSELIAPFLGEDSEAQNEYERIDTLMTLGTKLRQATRQADVVGRLGLAKIRTFRRAVSGDEKKPSDTRKIAYIIRSFKRPEEVALYRDTYGKAFTLVSVYSPRDARVRHLTRVLQGCRTKDEGPEELAVKLITRDYDENEKLGQQMGKTFPLADFFVKSGSRNHLDAQLTRLVRLLFGDPYISPTKDEQGMFFAQASALRSLDLSRQVGAAIVTQDGDILATGCNEVPKYGGGLYWDEDSGVARDFELGRDSNAAIKEELIEDAVRRLRENNWVSSAMASRSDAELTALSLYGPKPFFRDSRIFDVIEFGRAVHAEMAAITQAARNGVSVRGGRMFCTTFPCHICARHIVAAGITDLIFIEPYEKSRTRELYGDSVSVEAPEAARDRANFTSFVGVAPRRYMDFFAMTGERKTKRGDILDSAAIAERPRIKRIVFTYLWVEEMMVNETVRPIAKASEESVDEKA